MSRWKLEPTRITMPLLIAASFFGGLAWIGLYAIQYANGFSTPQPVWYGLIIWMVMIPFCYYAAKDNRKNNRPSHRIATWKYVAALIITLVLLWPSLKSTMQLQYDDAYLDGRKWYLVLGGAGVMYLLVLGVLSVRRKVNKDAEEQSDSKCIERG